MRFINILFVLFVFSGCASTIAISPYQLAVNNYEAASQSVELGMTISQVRAHLAPAQAHLRAQDKRKSDLYKQDETLVRIDYYRSGWVSDSVSTDDEYTPYLFNDGLLVAVGWQILGGPRNVARARDINQTTVRTEQNVVVKY